MTDNDHDPRADAEIARQRQAALDAAKEERRATLCPAEAARLATIEDVSTRLERAGIPFLLFADSTPPDDALERCCWWQFNKVGYEPDYDEMRKNAQRRIGSLVETGISHLPKAIQGALVWVTTDWQPIWIAKEGEVRRAKPSEEA